MARRLLSVPITAACVGSNRSDNRKTNLHAGSNALTCITLRSPTARLVLEPMPTVSQEFHVDHAPLVNAKQKSIDTAISRKTWLRHQRLPRLWSKVKQPKLTITPRRYTWRFRGGSIRIGPYTNRKYTKQGRLSHAIFRTEH